MPEVQNQIDTRALEIAIKASTKIDDHEKRCYELAEQNRGTLVAVDSKVNKVHTRIDDLVNRRNDRDAQVRNAVILTLLGVLGYLLANGAPWQ